MSAEVGPEEASRPDPAPVPKKKSIPKMRIAFIFVMGVFVPLANDYSYGGRLKGEAESGVRIWAEKMVNDDPSLTRCERISAESSHDLLGTWGHYLWRLTTRTGRTITIDFHMRHCFFMNFNRLALSTEGRSVTWPVKVMERAEKVDLKAEFPEAFR